MMWQREKGKNEAEHAQKSTQNKLKMNVRPKTMKHLKENFGGSSWTLVLAIIFGFVTLVSKAQKENRYVSTGLKSF